MGTVHYLPYNTPEDEVRKLTEFRDHYQGVVAKAAIILSEIDYELIEWAKAVHPSNQNRSTSA